MRKKQLKVVYKGFPKYIISKEDKLVEKEIIVTENAPAAIGPYSQAVKSGSLVFASGQLPMDPSSGKMLESDIESETKQALENLKAVLVAAGSSLDKVVKTTVFITDMSNFAKMNAVYSHYFGEGSPARSTIQVGALPKGAKVEIEAIAISK